MFLLGILPSVLMQRMMYKPLPSLPQGFVQERLAYFAGVEAYELEEESPQPDADQRSPRFVTEAEDEDFGVEQRELETHRRWRPLEAVAEEEVAEEDLEKEEEAREPAKSIECGGQRNGDGAALLPEEEGSERMGEPVQRLSEREIVDLRGGDGSQAALTSTSGRGLERILETSVSSEAPAGERANLQEGAAVPDGKASAKSDSTMDKSVRRLVFDEVPPNVPRGRRTSPPELARARGKKPVPSAKQTLVDVSNLAVADVSRGLDQLSLDAAPIGDEALNKRDARRSVDGKRGLSRRRSSLARHGRVAKEPETPLQAILHACGQDTMPSLNGFISKFQ